MATKATSTALDKSSGGALVPAPAFIAKGNQGKETIDPKDVMFERVALMQDLSPDVKQKKYQCGDIVRRQTEEVLYRYGALPLRIVIAYYFKEFVRFGDRDNPNEPAIMGRTIDPNSEIAEAARQFKKRKGLTKEIRDAVAVHNFIFLMQKEKASVPLTICCSRSNFKHGTSLLSLITARGDYPIYAGKYLFTAQDETNKKNQTYPVFHFRDDNEDPWATSDLYASAETIYKAMEAARNAGTLKGVVEADDADEDSGNVGVNPEAAKEKKF